MMRASLPICCSLLAMAGLCTIAGAEEVERSLEHERLTTFQMVARSEMVVHGRVRDGEGRFAIVEVLSILKGEPPGQQLRIDFRDLNLSTQGQAQVVFRDGEEYVLELEDGRDLRGDRLLVATGRRPRVDGIGLETVGIEPDPHGVPVDARLRVADRLWAVGDITGIWPLVSPAATSFTCRILAVSRTTVRMGFGLSSCARPPYMAMPGRTTSK